MRNILQLKNKKGFSLIECTVAIAIFAIMSGIVMLLIMSSMTIGKENDQIQSDMNTQLVEIAADNDVHRLALDAAAADVNVLEFDVDKNTSATGDKLKITYDKVEKVTGDVITDTSILLSAVKSNTVRYGTVPEDTAAAPNNVLTVPDGITAMTLNIMPTVNGATNPNNSQLYTKYVLEFASVTDAGSATRTTADSIQLSLPKCNEDVSGGAGYKYNIMLIDEPGHSGGLRLSNSKYSVSVSGNTINITSFDSDFGALYGTQVCFILVNNVNENDFEYDYKVAAGNPTGTSSALSKWWFGWGTGSSHGYTVSPETATLLVKN